MKQSRPKVIRLYCSVWFQACDALLHSTAVVGSARVAAAAAAAGGGSGGGGFHSAVWLRV